MNMRVSGSLPRRPASGGVAISVRRLLRCAANPCRCARGSTSIPQPGNLAASLR